MLRSRRQRAKKDNKALEKKRTGSLKLMIMQDEVMTRRYGWRALLKVMKMEGTDKESEVEIKILPIKTLSKAKQVNNLGPSRRSGTGLRPTRDIPRCSHCSCHFGVLQVHIIYNLFVVLDVPLRATVRSRS